MSIEPGSVEHLSQLISQVVAPAFLLGAVGSFVSLLSDRLMAVVHRIRDAGKGAEPELSGPRQEEIVARLRRRATLLNIAALILIITAFTAALISVHHVWLAAVLFIASAFFLVCSLISFGVDVKMAMTGHDLH